MGRAWCCAGYRCQISGRCERIPKLKSLLSQPRGKTAERSSLLFTSLIAAQSVVLPVSFALAVFLSFPAATALAASGDGATGKAAETAQLAIKVDQVGYPLMAPRWRWSALPRQPLNCGASATI